MSVQARVGGGEQGSEWRRQPASVVVFCDFDGTITEVETFVAMLRRHAPGADELIGEMRHFRVSLRQGVRQLLERIPSADWGTILDTARRAAIRSGFAELLDFCHTRGIPFVVVSGGLRGMIEATLAPYLHRISAVYAVDVDPAGEHLAIHSAFEGGDELVAKPQAMAHFLAQLPPIGDASPALTVGIGDGITDLTMMQVVDRAFARPPLNDLLAARGIVHMLWSDFHDIRRALDNGVAEKPVGRG